MVGLKPAYGGSTPPFLVSLIELGQKQAPQMCDKGEGSRVITPRLLQSALLLELHVWRQKPPR